MTTNQRDFNADRAIIDAATAGPWSQLQYGDRAIVSSDSVVIEPVGDDMTYLDVNEADARFIAEARIGWPVALDEIERLETHNNALRHVNHLQTDALVVSRDEIQRYRQALDSIVELGENGAGSTGRLLTDVIQKAKEALAYDGN